MSEKLKSASERIDAYYDSLLQECSTMEDAQRVEQRRTAAHAEISQFVMQRALSGFGRPGQ